MKERPDEGIDSSIKKTLFLSVEGNITEVDYFYYLNQFRNVLGVKKQVRIEVLGRHSYDTASDPARVVSLLDEYISLRECGIDSAEVQKCLHEKGKEYSIEFINDCIQSRNLDRRILSDCKTLINLDLAYNIYLADYHEEGDIFAVVIDRDCSSHSEQLLKTIHEDCIKKGYRFILSNPCFEFWLLLHLSDVAIEYANNMNDIKENKKISNRHTYVSSEVSQKASHSKGIPRITFQKVYCPNVRLAIERAKRFEEDEKELINSIGTNIPILLSELGING